MNYANYNLGGAAEVGAIESNRRRRPPAEPLAGFLAEPFLELVDHHACPAPIMSHEAECRGSTTLPGADATHG